MDTHRYISPLAYHTLKLICTLGLLTSLMGCPDGIDPSEIEERCSDGVDNNGDDLVDCEDPTCALFASCTGNEHCYNGVDDNGNGLIDCEEESCKALFICLQDIEDCANGRDDDGDGKIDCQDSACSQTSICKPGAEACSGGIDEDNDGKIDCDDPDCKSVFLCLANIEIPDNQLDDDGDGLSDCDDPDLAKTSACLDGGEVCNDGTDNDGDGLTDCQDPDCSATSTCLAPAEVCDNDLDDDNDGLIDCEDLNCQGTAKCHVEICGNGRDDDGNGLTDCQDAQCRYIGDCLMTAMNAAEICGNDADDDSDGLIDCDDPDCVNDASCRVLEVCANDLDDDGDELVDCDDPDCSSDVACLVEICDNGLDDDSDGDADCEDADCSAELSCQPEICDDGVDNNANGQLDCEDAGCASDVRCQCLALDKLTEPVTQQPIDDCSQTQCHPYFPSCQTDLPQELCEGDGIDNDGDGLIDCDDPDCQDFSDNNAYCTRALCGDPANNYLVVDFEDTNTGEPRNELYISSAQEFSDLFTTNQVTLFRGDIYVESFDGAPFPLADPPSLRCVLPHPTLDALKGQLMLDTQTLTSTSALSNLTVLGRLLFRDNAAFAPEFSDLLNLATILFDLEYVVPYYDATPPTPKTFEGLERLRRVGGDFIINYYGGASNDIQPRAFDLQGLNGLVEVGGDFLKRRHYYDEQDDPATFGCRMVVDPFYPEFSYFSGRFITLDSTQPLSALRRVGGTICFAPSVTMLDFTGLERLEFVGNHFFIMGPSSTGVTPVPVLSFTGLDSLRYVEGIFTNYINYGESDGRPRPIASTAPLTALESVGSFEFFLDDSFQDFNGLQNLVEIRGDFYLGAAYERTSPPPLVSLQGLNNLTRVDGEISFNTVDLEDFTGLDQLATVGSIDLYISDTSIPSFQSFAGLGALQTVTGSLAMTNYATMTQIAVEPFKALSALTSVGELRISGLANLISLDGLVSLTQLSSIVLSDLPALTNLTELSAISQLGSVSQFNTAISIYSTGITTLDDLSSLTSIRGDIILENNPNLVDIDQFERLTMLDAPYLSISNNPMLSQCLVNQAVTHMMSLDPDAFFSTSNNLACR